MLGVRLEVRLLALLAGWSPDIILFFLGLYFFFKMPR
jgi:hypothetical protein